MVSSQQRSRFEKAGLFMIISGVLHLPIFFIGGFSGKAIALTAIGVVWVLLGLGLRAQKKWLPCLCYLLMLGGMVAALTLLYTGLIPNWWVWLIFLADFLAALFLFRLIWAKP